MHQYCKLPYEEPFRALEPLLAAHGGRPHWAKRHTLSAHDVLRHYPMAEQFKRVREQVDPENKLANDYLLRLLALGGLIRLRFPSDYDHAR